MDVAVPALLCEGWLHPFRRCHRLWAWCLDSWATACSFASAAAFGISSISRTFLAGRGDFWINSCTCSILLFLFDVSINIFDVGFCLIRWVGWVGKLVVGRVAESFAGGAVDWNNERCSHLDICCLKPRLVCRKLDTVTFGC